MDAIGGGGCDGVVAGREGGMECASGMEGVATKLLGVGRSRWGGPGREVVRARSRDEAFASQAARGKVEGWV